MLLLSKMTSEINNRYIKTEHGDVNYYVYGRGPKAMLCFHGFGLDGLAMLPLAKAHLDTYTYYSFDLFYHGKTFWTSKEVSHEKIFWKELISEFLKEENINRFSLAAFSLGGKLALLTTEYFALQIEELILLAPDGIKTSSWYNLSSYPTFIKKYVKTTIVKPHRFHRIINILKTVGAIDSGILKFANSQMDTIRKRKRVYYSWIVFKNLVADLSVVTRKINDQQIRVTLYLGAYDKIITPDGLSKFTGHLDNIVIKTLESGHNDLIEHSSADISQADLSVKNEK